MRRGGKYGVAPVEERTAEGIVFHSKREKDAYVGFRILEKTGQIAKLECQVPFHLFALRPRAEIASGLATDTGVISGVGVKVGIYIADFRITERDGTIRIYETKGVRTPEYKLKKKIFSANYPHLRIVEI